MSKNKKETVSKEIEEKVEVINEDEVVQDTFNTDSIDELLGEGVEIINE